ncbi:TfoX/Sxy family protein [Algoriphagus aestuariicola]|uniref:TfoX/Sxy family protein n=1 Tax=Algoriphagus aestuariicola TaxID=1852016 RepID=A0ABS3BVD5_9BACT|nr:TfoX/Sxy family protein [Algoriphagus aestuariicola]MBN7802305.1 TfoX/Sxy family protein [Algoriphagus aestuariicola]
MAFDPYQSDRISRTLKDKGVTSSSKKMMGGLCFLVDDKMLLGLDQDKKTLENRLMVRVGPAAYPQALEKLGCCPMDFTGKPMKGYVFVYPEGFDLDEQLEEWIDLAMTFNPLAKKSKK